MEDESNEIPVADPKPPGMNSFLDMNDDDGDGDDGNKHTSEKPDKPRVKGFPPYDTSLPSNVNFSSEIIGTTVRRGAFLSVPGELEDCSSESSESSSLSEVDFSCSPYDGIATSDSEVDFCCSPYDGIVTTTPTLSSSTRRQGMADMAYFAENLKDRIAEEGFNLVSTISCRTGLLDLSKFAEMDPTMSWGSLEQLRTLDDEPAISNCNIGVHDTRNSSGDSPSNVDPVAAPHGAFLSAPGELEGDLSECLPSYADVDFHCSPYSPFDPPCSCSSYDGFTTTDSGSVFPSSPFEGADSDFEFSCLPYEQAMSNGKIGFHDPCTGSGDGSSDIDVAAAPHVGLDLMRRLLAELRDPNLDYNARPLSEDSESEYSANEEEEEASIPRLTSTSVLHNGRGNFLESTSTHGTDSDVTDEGPICPLTPPSEPSTTLSSAHGVRMDRMSPAVVPGLNGEVLAMSPTSWDLPPSFPTKAYVRSYRDDCLYGPRVPLLSLPRL